jgi:HJR/Mrr/RecB family endonuclease
MKHYQCSRSVVVTNSTFTSGARDLEKSTDSLLIDGSQIPDLIMGRIF